MTKRKTKKRHKRRKDGGQEKTRRDLPGGAMARMPAPCPEVSNIPEATTRPQPPSKQDGNNLRRFGQKIWGLFCRGNRPFTTALVVFTGAQVIVGYWQWSATRDQYDAMMGQNAVAARQAELASGQLRQAIKATGQTEKILELMWLEQSPWLGITPVIDDFIVGEPLKCILVISNSGRTPGVVHRLVFRIFIGPAPVNIDSLMQNLSDKSVSISRENVVPAEAKARFLLDGTPIMDDATIKDISHGTQVLIIAGRFIYRDVRDKSHGGEFCFVWDPKTNLPVAHDKYNGLEIQISR